MTNTVPVVYFRYIYKSQWEW